MKILKSAGYVLVVGIGAALLWLFRWLYINRVFADPTALKAEDGLAVQAAWAQAILSVLAVLVAIWVAKAQSNESRKLIEDEVLRIRAKEDQESNERQSLARTALDDAFEHCSAAVALLRKEDDGEWHVALHKLELGANSAAGDFARVSPVLRQTPSGALHCFHIEEMLAKFARGRAEFFSPLMVQGPHGVQIFNPEPLPDVAKEVATKIEGDLGMLLGHVRRL